MIIVNARRDQTPVGIVDTAAVVDATSRDHDPRIVVANARVRRAVGIADNVEVDVARRVDSPSVVGTIRVRRALSKIT